MFHTVARKTFGEIPREGQSLRKTKLGKGGKELKDSFFVLYFRPEKKRANPPLHP